MTLPYSSASSGDKAMAEIQKILQKFNCKKFGSWTDLTEGTLTVQFEWNGRTVMYPASFKGYAAAYLKESPYTSRMRCTKQEYEAKANEIGAVAVYSILRDLIKAQVTAVETGLIEFDEAFTANIMLPNGKRMIEHARDNKLLIKG